MPVYGTGLGLRYRYVHVVSRPPILHPPVQGRQGGHGRHLAGEIHPHSPPELDRLPMRRPGEQHRASGGELHYLRCLAVLVGPVLSEVGYRSENHTGVEPLDPGVSQPESRHHTGPEALHDYLGPPGQQLEHLDARRTLEVQRNAELIVIEELEQRAGLGVGEVIVERAQPAARVAAARPLDLDDVGAVVGEQLGAERPGDVMGQVQHTGPGEGLGQRAALGTFRHDNCANIAGRMPPGKNRLVQLRPGACQCRSRNSVSTTVA